MAKIRNIFQVTKELHFCYGHRLMDYQGKCMHPHGHNGRLAVTFTTSHLDERGMVLDFIDIKEILQAWIDEKLDHTMILRKDDPLVSTLKKLQEPVFLMDKNPTAENIAELIFHHVQKKGFPVTSVQFWETPTSSAVYQAKTLK